MKKKISALLLAAILVLSLGLLSACGFELFKTETDGSFPSDTRGEEGSRESWLAALENPATTERRLYEEAVSDGSFTGSYMDFLKEVGVNESAEVAVNTALRSAVSIYARFSASGKNDYYSGGAGIIYSLDTSAGDALIVTNYHVVYNAGSSGSERVRHISDDISVYLYGQEIEERAIAASYLGGAMDYDIAVLQITGSELLKETNTHPVYATEAVAGDSDSLTVGERVYAIGNPEASGLGVSEGVVSVDAEYIDVAAADEKSNISLLEIRTDAAVNHGNSGGGLFNASGKLIGIVNARDESEGVVGFGYAIPSNLALSLAQNIIDTCKANKNVRGASVAKLNLTAKTEDTDGVYDETTGKYYIEERIAVFETFYGGAAYAAGIHTGDTLLTAKLFSTREGAEYTREVAITRLFKLTNLLFEVRLGDKLEVTVSRGGVRQTLTVDFSSESYFTALS